MIVGENINVLYFNLFLFFILLLIFWPQKRIVCDFLILKNILIKKTKVIQST